MRSKLGTKSRLAAHILALILLIMMLVYIVPATTTVDVKAPWATKNFDNLPPAGITPGSGKSAGNLEIATSQPAESATITQPKEPAATKTPEPGAMKPPAEKTPSATENIATAPVEDKAAPAASSPAAVQEDSSTVEAEPAAGISEPAVATVDTEAPAEPTAEIDSDPAKAIEATADAKQPNATAATPAPDAKTTEAADVPSPDGAEGEGTAAPASIAPGMTDTGGIGAEAATETGAGGGAASDAPQENTADAATPQPDEAGLTTSAASGAETPGSAALEPLPNTNLQVLGDGVYWLNPEDELEKELSAIPEIGTLIYLTNMPGLKPKGFEHVKTAVIPADAADLTADTAERFLHLADSGAAPVVAAVLPGARGAAYFKGVYLLTNRKLGLEETLREIKDELEDAGTTADEIIHRLRRFAGKGQQASAGQNGENTEKE